MNKIVNKINKILLIILITLIGMTTMVNAASVSNPKTDRDLSDAAKDATLGATKNKNQQYFEVDPAKLIGKWIDASDTKGDSKAPYQHIGEYCIDARTSANGSDDFIIRNIIDLTPEGKIISYYYAGKDKNKKPIIKTVESENATLVKALKSMSYCSIKSIKASEGRIKNGNAWKVAIAGIVDDNIKKMGDELKLYKGFQQPMDSGSTAKKKEAVKSSKDKAYTARFIFLYGDGKQNQIIFGAKEGESRGDLTITKIGGGNKKLGNVGFQLQHNKTGKWVRNPNNSDKAEYVDRSAATTFSTGATTGTTTIKGLLAGDYTLYETVNPNYGYECNPSEGISVATVKAGNNNKVVPNKQKYIKLSGYVWKDEASDKTGDLTKINHSYDTGDTLLDGITVKLKDRTGKEADRVTTTANGGSYLFTDVLVENLGNYYVEFEYNGLTYTNVNPYVPSSEASNASKAIEGQAIRERFNKNFSSVEGRERNSGVTLNEEGNESQALSYDTSEAHKAILINKNDQYPITASTEEAKYSIVDHFTPGEEEVKYINLGLYQREQPDISLMKDIHNVKLTINGYENTYRYGQRGKYDPEGFNVGVRFGEKADEYGNMTYRRALYKADYQYENPVDKSKELQAYITYEIKMNNQSSSLITQVNSIADYFDNRYQIISVGTGVERNGDTNKAIGYRNENGELVGDISIQEGSYGTDGKYAKAIIKNNTRIEKGTTSIYIQFKLSREQILDILKDKQEGQTADESTILENVAEINSYSIFDKNGIYAGIDKNSNPGNCTPGDRETYEDDTDASPGLLLEVADARTLEGTVFEDKATGGLELHPGVIRQGDGEYKPDKPDEEKGIEGVEIKFTDTKGSGKEYTATTDANGYFNIPNYIPGDYLLTYTWGDEHYTVQEYKGTIYKEKERAEKGDWYKQENPRYSDARDDYDVMRQEIDNEMKTFSQKTQITKNKMVSTTPMMEVGIEYETTETASMGLRYEYKIRNIDFGIIERARQDLKLTKRVESMKVTLANGQVLVNLTVDENGNITGERNHITYMKPDEADKYNGFIRLELDNELMQGAKVEVGYGITIENQSELDYLDKDFYLYGEVKGDKITITPSKIVDYLDKDWAFDNKEGENAKWEIKAIENIQEYLEEPVYKSEDSTIANKMLLWTESLADKKLAPGDKEKLNINVSKLLSTTDEISLNNETEMIEIQRNGGSKPESIPGNYVPGAGLTEADDSMAETTIVTPNTGENQNYIVPVMIGATALIILAAGVIIIKKKAI